jgi:hypothetical protein
MNPPSCRITFHKTQFTYIVQTRTLDSVVTTEANELMARIHPRMPVILHSREYDRWLDREETEQLPLDLLRPLSRSAYLSYQSTCASTPSVVALRNEHLVFGQTQGIWNGFMLPLRTETEAIRPPNCRSTNDPPIVSATAAIALVTESRRLPGRKDSMKLRRFLSIVPKTVQLWASVLAGCALLTGLVVGYEAAGQGAMLRTMSTYGSAASVLGIALAIWLLCIGFVFAVRRN